MPAPISTEPAAKAAEEFRLKSKELTIALNSLIFEIMRLEYKRQPIAKSLGMSLNAAHHVLRGLDEIAWNAVQYFRYPDATEPRPANKRRAKKG